MQLNPYTNILDARCCKNNKITNRLELTAIDISATKWILHIKVRKPPHMEPMRKASAPNVSIAMSHQRTITLHIWCSKHTQGVEKCLSCHVDLLAKPSSDLAKETHTESLKSPDEPDSRCIECHEDVGHQR